jgi:phenylacetic acid degradation operon negative regulatory protein
VIYQVPEQQRRAREVLRKRLAFLGYGSLAPATWISARNHSEHVTAIADDLIAIQPGLQITQLVARGAGGSSDRELAHRCWQLDELNGQYKEWLGEWAPTLKKIQAARLTGPEALIARVRLVRSFRGFPFSDPELPSDLLPKPWLGTDAYLAFMKAHKTLEHEANAWFHSVLQRSAGSGSLARGR